MATQPDRKTPTHELLLAIGGQLAISIECEVSESAVSQWATENQLPKAREKYLRLAHPGKHWDEYEAARQSANDEQARAAG
jgi:hypothetical protein